MTFTDREASDGYNGFLRQQNLSQKQFRVCFCLTSTSPFCLRALPVSRRARPKYAFKALETPAFAILIRERTTRASCCRNDLCTTNDPATVGEPGESSIACCWTHQVVPAAGCHQKLGTLALYADLSSRHHAHCRRIEGRRSTNRQIRICDSFTPTVPNI